MNSENHAGTAQSSCEKCGIEKEINPGVRQAHRLGTALDLGGSRPVRDCPALRSIGTHLRKIRSA